MQVLKFGGTSVANAENIQKVAAIVKQITSKDKTIVVVSALGGITDILIQSGELAASMNESYKEKLQVVEQRHLDAVKSLLPVAQQSSLLSWVKKSCNEIEDICNGIFLLGELSPRTKDRIVSYGELMSSHIISTYLNAAGISNTWKDSRQIIITDSNFGYAAVDFTITNKKINQYFSTADSSLFIMPGFVSSNETGTTTTLGRGGSDYTAAILAA
ncbi:MAG: bifunctional aspartate kinase/homoserine dehydrogenase I, partial [Bacteroidota bacterium]